MAVQKTYSSQKEIAEIWKLFRETDRKNAGNNPSNERN